MIGRRRREKYSVEFSRRLSYGRKSGYDPATRRRRARDVLSSEAESSRGGDGAILPRRARRVGILRRRNAIHKILKFRHVVSSPVSQTRARECRRRRRVFPELCARLVSPAPSCSLRRPGYVAHIFLSSRLFLHLRFWRTTLT